MVVFYELVKYTICFIAIVYAWFTGDSDPMSAAHPVINWFETTWADKLAVGYYNWYMSIIEAPNDILMTPKYLLQLLFVIFALVLDLAVSVCIEWFGLGYLIKWKTKQFRRVKADNTLKINDIYTNIKYSINEIEKRNN